MTRNYAVIDRDGYFRDRTHVQSAHVTEAAAIRAANKQRVSIPGQPTNQSCAMVIRNDSGCGFRKGEMIYSDTIRSLYPVVW